MIRMFAIGLGVGTVRVAGVFLIGVYDHDVRSVIAPSFWLGWIVTVAGAEGWLRWSRLR
jgi:hypothetical protein